MNFQVIKFIYKLPVTLAVVNGLFLMAKEIFGFNIYSESVMGFFILVAMVYSMVNYYKISQRGTPLKILLTLGTGVMAFLIFTVVFSIFSQVLVNLI